MSSDCFSYCQTIACILPLQWKKPWSLLLLDVKFVFLNPFSSFAVHFKTFAMQKDDNITYPGVVSELGDMQQDSFQSMV